MERNDIKTKVIPFLAELTGLEESKITVESSLIEDLEIESFDLVDLNPKNGVFSYRENCRESRVN